MTVAIVVAAGRGRRLGGPIPKQYRSLDSIPVIRHTLMAFLRHPEISDVQTVIHPDDLELYEGATEGLSLRPPVFGGNTRQESVHFGLESFADAPPDKVLIHDAVRPFVEQATISAVIAALDERPAVITGLSIPDTLKRCGNGIVEATIDRSGLWRAQTPQGFHFAELLNAHEKVRFANPDRPELTDDSLVIEHYGLPVGMIEGGDDNFKITTERDLVRAELVLARGRQETHVGWGFDFATSTAGDHVVMCGVTIPSQTGLVTVTDSDIPLNAIADALRGTLGNASAKSHSHTDMPSSRGDTSDARVRQAVSSMAMSGGRISHLDLTILGVAPSIEPHRDAIITRLAFLLSIDAGRISVKQAETCDIGFYGRGDGIGAQCAVTAMFPTV